MIRLPDRSKAHELKSYDVVILGIGAMGSAAAYHLSRRGARVLGLERFSIAHDRGSSHGRSRMIRLAYFEHPDYVPLLRRAYDLWDELSRQAAEKLLFRTGGLYLGTPDCELIDGALRAAREHGLQYDLLDSAGVMHRFPQFRVPVDAVGVFEDAAGFLLPERVIRSQVGLAQKHGAQILENEKVIDWSADDRGVVVRTTSGTHHAAQLVLCAGAWLPSLVPALRGKLRVSRQVLAWFKPLREDLALGRMPVWGIGHKSGGLHYGFPAQDAADGFKAALHLPAETADPDSIDRSLRQADLDAIRGTLDQWLPAAAGAVLRHSVCMYTNTPDGHFILDRHPQHENVLVTSCCSGHGFKFASVIGEAIADLVTAGRTELPIGFFRLSRLGSSFRRS